MLYIPLQIGSTYFSFDFQIFITHILTEFKLIALHEKPGAQSRLRIVTFPKLAYILLSELYFIQTNTTIKP